MSETCILPHSFQHTSAHVGCPISHLKTKNQRQTSKQKNFLNSMPWRYYSICLLLITSVLFRRIPFPSLHSFILCLHSTTHQAFDPIHTMDTAPDKVSSAFLPSPLARSSCFPCSNSEQLLKVDYSVLPETPSLLWRRQIARLLPTSLEAAFPHGTPYLH